MTQNFTPNHLIKYIYKETSLAESLAIEEALAHDWNLHETYEELCKAYLQLPKAQFSPKPSTIQNILKYSAQTGVPA
ncbi:MAG TPA: hypothetical protein ENJ45_01455 [Phaeodactylibacter sp.]|nr:hypothetical protein [Phaeodactylibacter sp.]